MASSLPEHTDRDFQITSTIRYDPELARQADIPESYPPPTDSPYYLLSHHRDRLLSAAIDFHWEDAIALLSRNSAVMLLTEAMDKNIPDRTQAYRLRLLIDKKGQITVENTPTTGFLNHNLLITASNSTIAFPHRLEPSAPRPWTLRLDTQPTNPSLFTKHKTTRREQYTASRNRAGIKSYTHPAEVLLYNPAGEVMEGSITTVYVRRRTPSPVLGQVQWVTPPLLCGGNAGVTRRYALAGGACEVGVVKVDELLHGELVWLSNALKGFMPAILQLEKRG